MFAVHEMEFRERDVKEGLSYRRLIKSIFLRKSIVFHVRNVISKSQNDIGFLNEATMMKYIDMRR